MWKTSGFSCTAANTGERDEFNSHKNYVYKQGHSLEVLYVPILNMTPSMAAQLQKILRLVKVARLCVIVKWLDVLASKDMGKQRENGHGKSKYFPTKLMGP